MIPRHDDEGVSSAIRRGGVTKKSSIFSPPIGRSQFYPYSALFVAHVHKVRITPQRLEYE